MRMPPSHGFTLLRRFALATLFVAAAAACVEPADDVPPSPSPRLTRVDSVALVDTGSFALGSLANAGLHVGDSALWIGDPANGRVVSFGRDGRVLGQAGRRGRGPGEIGATGPIAAFGDGTIAVWDYGANKLLAFDARDGALRWETVVREHAVPMQFQAVGDTLWFGVVSLQQKTGAMRLVARDSAATRLAPLPMEYTEGVARSFPYSVALRLGDTVLVGYAGHHRVFLHRADDAPRSVIVPARRRRGVPPDLLQQIQSGLAGREPGKGAENYVSTLSRLARLGDGSIAFLHYDVEFNHERDAPAHADAWLTIVDPAWRRACVDAKLPLLERTLPSLAFRGDTLFTLEHVVTGDRTTPTLRAFVISTALCEWVELTER